MKIYDLRTDTITKPDEAMRKAIYEAECGDDVYMEDPTVNKLQEMAAEITGKEKAIFVSSGTMGNLIPMLIKGTRSKQMLLEEESHIMHYELGGASSLAGIMTITTKADRGILTKSIVEKFPNVKTVIKNINNKNTNVILGEKDIVLYGDGHIYDKLGKYIFKISAKSFYQTNPIQTEKLYNKAIEYARLDKNDILCDLYCGIGTIGIFASNKVKKVHGIEIVEEAVEAAKENAKLNNIKNIEFIAGDAKGAFRELIDEKNIKPTAIIVDPPRRGLDEETIKKILELEIKKFVYISCNPATMVRDIKMLEEKYIVNEIQPVDMFPFTSHVECCALLELKNCQ